MLYKDSLQPENIKKDVQKDMKIWEAEIFINQENILEHIHFCLPYCLVVINEEHNY